MTDEERRTDAASLRRERAGRRAGRARRLSPHDGSKPRTARKSECHRLNWVHNINCIIFTRIHFQQNTDEQTSCVWLGRLSATAGWLPTSVRAATEPARFVSRRARRAGPCFSSRTESAMPEQLPRRGPRKPISLLKIVFCPRTLAINAHTRVSITRGEKDGTR